MRALRSGFRVLRRRDGRLARGGTPPGAPAALSSTADDRAAAPRGAGGARRKLPRDGLSLTDFAPGAREGGGLAPSALADGGGGVERSLSEEPLRFHVETYGCQMNVSDSEIVAAILCGAGHEAAASAEDADVVFLNTCAVRDNAEAKIWAKLRELRARRTAGAGLAAAGLRPFVGVLGCMAERLKDRLLAEERLVDLVAGPDAYRDLPRLLDTVLGGDQAMNVQLSLEETYADIAPLRLAGSAAGARWRAEQGLGAFLSIMRGCNNMCTFCIVPFTRGRERSRDAASVLREVEQLRDAGVKEITLLGQNVNSYFDRDAEGGVYGYATSNEGFTNQYKLRSGDGVRFTELLDQCSAAAPGVRFRFTSPHPKDFPPQLLQLIAERPNVCSSLHLPLQSGSSRLLEVMNRGYTQEAFLRLVDDARSTIPGVALSTDTISGFCGETEEDHAHTLTAMRHSRFEQAFMFAYSEREKTRAHRRLEDDVPKDVKLRRLREVIDLQAQLALEQNEMEVGRTHRVLVEGESKRSTAEHPQLTGRSDNNKRCIFAPPEDVRLEAGDYVDVRVVKAMSGRSLLCAVDAVREGP